MSEKISLELKAELEKIRVAGEPQKIRIMIELAPTIARAQIKKNLYALVLTEDYLAKVVYKSKVSPYMAVEVDQSKVEAIAGLSWVKMVWHVPKVYPLGLRYLEPAQLAESICLIDTAKHLNIDALKLAGYTGAGIKIGIVDSGIDTSHPMLAGKVTAERNFTPDGPDCGDRMSHGTWCASCLAGKYWRDSTGREYEGMAPDAMLINAKIFETDGASIEICFAALEWAAEQGSQVCSCSWGGPEYTPFRTLLSNLTATYGTIFVFAAGNVGPDYETIMYPAGYPEVVAVGSIAVRNPTPNKVADFSARGPSIIGFPEITKPDIMAPGGVDVKNWTTPEEIVCGAGLNQGFRCIRGTSMATPHISGGLALLVQAGVADPVKRLYETASDIVDVGKDNDSGYGVANFAKALNLPIPNSHLLTVDVSLQGALLSVNNILHLSPCAKQLREGTYTIIVQKTIFTANYIYEFTNWEDGDTSLTKTIELTSDTTIRGFYKQLAGASLVHGLESALVDQAFPNQAMQDYRIKTRAFTYTSGITAAVRSFMKFDLSQLPTEKEIIRARLYLSCNQLTYLSPRQIELHSVDDDTWKPSSITWNNKPTLGRLLATVQVNDIEKFFEWDITDYLISELGKILSLCIKDAVEETTPGYPENGYNTVFWSFNDFKNVPYILVEYREGPQHSVSLNSIPILVPLTVDGLSVGSTPKSIMLTEGEHVISVPLEVET